MAIKSFKNLLAEVKATDHYAVESAKFDFVKGITRLLKRYNITQSALASKMETSPAYITKALRGDTNFTIESMVKLAQAANGTLHIHVADQACSVRWMEVVEKTAQQPVLRNRQLHFWKGDTKSIHGRVTAGAGYGAA